MNTPSNPRSNQEWLQALRDIIDTQIPLSRAMQLEILEFKHGYLHARAPLAPNINDKGTAFGGSQAALMTLLGWGLVWLETRKKGYDCDIVIHKGEIIWHQALNGELLISCAIPDKDTLDVFFKTLMRRGKAGLSLQVTIGGGANISTEFNCRYVALRKGD